MKTGKWLSRSPYNFQENLKKSTAYKSFNQLQEFQQTTIHKSDRKLDFQPTNQGLNLKTRQTTFKIGEKTSENIENFPKKYILKIPI